MALTAARHWVHFLGARNRPSRLRELSHLIVAPFLRRVCHYHHLKFTDEERGIESSNNLPNTAQLVEPFSGFGCRKACGQSSLTYVRVVLGIEMYQLSDLMFESIKGGNALVSKIHSMDLST